MKNFPDQNQFHELVKRLQSYAEQPEELVWKNIDTALRPNRTLRWFSWFDRATSMIMMLFLVSMYAEIPSGNKIYTGVATGENKPRTSDDRNEFFLKHNELKDESSADITNERVSSRQHVAKAYTANSDKSETQSINDIHETQLWVDSIQQQGHENEVYTRDSLFASSLKTKPDSAMDISTEVQETKRLRKRKTSFYAYVTPMLSFQRATPVSRDGVVVTNLFNRSILSAERFAISFDAGMQGFMSKRFEYYTGLSLYRQTQTLRYAYQLDGQANVESSGDKDYIVMPKLITADVNYDMMNIGINAGLIYYLYGKRLMHKVGAGFSYQQGFGKSSSEVYKNGESSYLSYQIFYRNEVRINRRLKVFLQPAFTHTVFVKEKLEAPFTLKPYNAGIGFGVIYDF